MQIFKNFLLACSIAVATSPLYLQAEDNDAQAAARAALQQRMRELKGTAGTVETPAPAHATEMSPTPPPTSAPASEPERPATPPNTVYVPPGASPDLIEQARQATRARVAELKGYKITTLPVGQETAVAQPVYQAAEAAAPVTTVVTPAVEPSSHNHAERQAEPTHVKAHADSGAKAGKAPKKSKPAKVTEQPLVFTPVAAPATGLPLTKEQALNALTEQYKADKITAEEYHEQRAKILAEP